VPLRDFLKSNSALSRLIFATTLKFRYSANVFPAGLSQQTSNIRLSNNSVRTYPGELEESRPAQYTLKGPMLLVEMENEYANF
jgi:hypothetical protein